MPRLQSPSLALLFGMVLLLEGCATGPVRKIPSTALEDPYETTDGQIIKARVDENGGQSGFWLLHSGADAFAARLALTELATRTVDLQYYIAEGQSVSLLCEGLLEAADRGVRVRLLLDDLSAQGEEALLAILDAHPCIEVRVWNPVFSRGFRPFSRLFEFIIRGRQLNRRMHNKVFVADNLLGIIGGRNLGDEYFDAPGVAWFQDLDVLAAGPVVQEMSASFDAYWNSDSAVPLKAVSSRRPKSTALREAKARLEALREEVSASTYGELLRTNQMVLDLNAHNLAWIWARAYLLADDPAKTEEDLVHGGKLLEKLEPAFTAPTNELLVICPYFVPGKKGVRLFANLAKKGVTVRILSNSLAGNDAWIAHCGYQRYRKSLLKNSVQLFELRPALQKKKGPRGRTAFGSALAVLHAKTFVIDRQIVFIGSMNLDPRSTELNTEVGLVIVSPELAEEVAGTFEWLTDRRNAYHLSLDPKTKDLKWTCEDNGQAVEYFSEPEAGFWLRLGVAIFSLFPIESQL